MPNSYFQFKQFIVHQENCGMKVSTDAVVLGALASHEESNRILDVGTGTGVVALMLAQRFPTAEIHGVEIEDAAFEQASNNFSSSPWRHRLTLYHQSFQDFAKRQKDSFDLIVSNPPYYPSHLKSHDRRRSLALHNDKLSFGDLVQNVVQLLAPGGKFWVILPERQMQDLEKITEGFYLFGNESFELKDRPQGKVLRVVKAFSFHEIGSQKEILHLRDKDLNFSTTYRNYWQIFYWLFNNFRPMQRKMHRPEIGLFKFSF